MSIRYFSHIFVVFLFSSISLFANADLASQRLITIDGALTEIVFALGAGDNLVAVDETSVYPPHVQNLPSVGYLRSLSAEGILSLQADHVFTSQDAGPPEILKQIAATKVPITVIDQPYSEAGLYEKIKILAEVLGKYAEGNALIKKLQHEFAEIDTPTARSKPKVLFVMSSTARGIKVAGRDTRADALIRMAGATNAITSFLSYKPLTLESAILIQPDVILVLSEEGESFDPASHRILSITPAVKHGKVFNLEGDELTFGTRLPQAVNKIQAWIYE